MNDPEDARLERILRAGRPEEDGYRPRPLDSLLTHAAGPGPVRPSRPRSVARGFGVVSMALAVTVAAIAVARSMPPASDGLSGGSAPTSGSPSPSAGVGLERLLGSVVPWSGAYLGCGLSASGETLLVTVPATGAQWAPVADIPVRAGRCDVAAGADGSIKVVTAEGADPTAPTQVWTVAGGATSPDGWSSGLTVSALRTAGDRWTAVGLEPGLSVSVVDVDRAGRTSAWALPTLPTSVGVVDAGYDVSGHRWVLGGVGRAAGVVTGDQGSAVVAKLDADRWVEKTFDGLWPVSLWFDREGAVVVVYDPSASQSPAFRSADGKRWEEVALPQDASVIGVSGSGLVVARVNNDIWAVSKKEKPQLIGSLPGDAFVSVADELVLIGSKSGVKVLGLPRDGP